jgi:phosphomannomutase
MNPLKIGITGVRGVVGETFTPHLVAQFAEAFATCVGQGKVYICDDARRSGSMVRGAAISGLLAAGCSTYDLGVCPIPSMQRAIAASGAAGGIAVSAGHNSEDWNALKFIRSDGFYFNAREADELLDVYHSGEFERVGWDKIVPLRKIGASEAVSEHIAAIVDSVDARRIKKAGLKVAVDTCNGACSEAASELLDALGCKTVAINAEQGEPFPHDPEPNEANMRQTRSVARAVGCDAGFMLDTAGERLGIVTDEGVILPEDYTLALCVSIWLSENPGGLVVTNLSTTGAIDALAKKHKAAVMRTRIGQAYVAEAAAKHKAAIAGEGSGGVIFPRLHYACDGMAAMAFILDFIARTGSKLSSTASAIPKFVTLKKNAQLDFSIIHRAIHHVRTEAKTRFLNANIDLSDGVKLGWANSWLHIRPSNTEPIIRIMAEAKSEKRARELISIGEELIGG